MPSNKTIDINEAKKARARRAREERRRTRKSPEIDTPEAVAEAATALDVRTNTPLPVKIIWGILAAGLVFAILQPMSRLLLKPYLLVCMRTQPAVYGALETGIQAPCIFVRDETVVMTPISGRISLKVADGERVRKGVTVLEVNKQPGDVKADKALDTAQEDLRTKSLEFAKQAEQFDKRITQAQAEVDRAKSTLGTKKSPKARARARLALKSAIETMRSTITQRQEYDQKAKSILSRLQEKVDAFSAAVGQERFTYKADPAGVVSYAIDGLEGALSYTSRDDNLAKALEKAFENESSDELDSSKMTDNQLVKAGDPVARLINNFNLYAAVVMTSAHTEQFEKGKVNITFDSLGPKRYQALLDKILPGPEGESIALFELYSYTDAFNQLRRDNAHIISERREGIIIPASSITKKYDVTGVYLSKGLYPVFQKAEVLGSNGQKCIVSGIPEGSRVVRNPNIIPASIR